MDKKKSIFSILVKIAFFLSIFFIFSCSKEKEKKERQVFLYQAYCASCHMLPAIDDLPKEIWATKLLPDMAARMGIKDGDYNPLKDLQYEEMQKIHDAGIYPAVPILSKEDWSLLKNYILDLAPDSLTFTPYSNTSKPLTQFIPKPITLDTIQGSVITFLEYDKKEKKLWTGDLMGNLSTYDFDQKKTTSSRQFPSAVVGYSTKGATEYVTAIGRLDPSELSSGKIITINDGRQEELLDVLHRPVNTLVTDLNKDGTDELVISEFGNFTGVLSLFDKKDGINYQKRILLNQPGTILVLAKDMNKDGKDDLIALTSQGDETITILYQKDSLQFTAEKVLRFPPIYGSSWFELLDFNGDGYDDIITVNGDNADKTYVQKPYHGMRIHINNGDNTFVEKYFYSLNGTTRLLARDFDQDGDTDFALISTFPDYENKPEFAFVYLETKDKNTFAFEPYTFKESTFGRWFLLDSGDIDNDGDEDIILSSFTYVFTPVPADVTKLWNEKNVDIMVLENTLKSNKLPE